VAMRQDHLRKLLSRAFMAYCAPVDAIQCLRLEMGQPVETPGRVNRCTKILGRALSDALNTRQAEQRDQTAESAELRQSGYLWPVDLKRLSSPRCVAAPFATVHGRTKSDGKGPKLSSFYAKKASARRT